MSKLIWSQTDPWFGGFSGAEVTEDGTDITLITDKGSLVTATMLRENGVLTALKLRGHVLLTPTVRVSSESFELDAEGLAMDAHGHAFVSFEQDHRVEQVDLDSARILGALTTTEFVDLQDNSGLEALAVHPDGTLYTLPERSGMIDTPFPVFTHVGGEWHVAHHIPRRGPFLPVGADFSDDGLFYLLERAVTPLGFRSRIRRFDLAAPDLDEEVLLTTGPGQFDNFEAISIWRDMSGQTFVTLVSDDNFLPIQQTQIVEFALEE